MITNDYYWPCRDRINPTSKTLATTDPQGSNKQNGRNIPPTGITTTTMITMRKM
jgi:hypothetical protein